MLMATLVGINLQINIANQPYLFLDFTTLADKKPLCKLNPTLVAINMKMRGE